MTSKSFLAFFIAAFLCAVTFAEKPVEKPPSKTGLLRPGAVPTPSRPVTAKGTPAPASSAEAAPGEPVKPGKEGKDKPPEKKAKAPTIITSREATFDQKANVAVFIGDVVVVDPEFNVHCDKMTAHLKNDDKAKPGAATQTPKPGATPAAKPDAKAGAPPDDAAAKKKAGGLEKAVAESTSELRVIINQDKTEADGTVTHGIGRADKATYDAVTGDVVLYGSPEVIQGAKSVVALDPAAIIILNRDGHMHTVGRTKTTIDNKDDSR